MAGWNLPPGCTDADIDRAMGGDEECYHEEFEIRFDGLAICSTCGESWLPTQHDIEHFRYCNELYDAHCRREERRQWWRDQWERIARPWRWLWYRVSEKLGMPKRAANCLRDDEIPF